MTAMVKVPVTASTGKGNDRKEKTVEFDCPRFDPALRGLLEFYKGDAKALFKAWFDGVFKIEKQAEVRRELEEKAPLVKANKIDGLLGL